MPKEWLPVIGVIVGWLLHEVSSRSASRRAERIQLGECLAALLVVHRYIGGTLQLMKRLTPEQLSKLEISTTADFLDLVEWEQQADRLKKASESLAGFYPLVSFQLLSIQALLDVLPSDPPSKGKAEQATNIESPTFDYAEDAFHQIVAAVLRVARMHSVGIFLRVWWHLRRPVEIPERILKDVRKLEDWLQRRAMYRRLGVCPPESEVDLFT